MGGVVPFPDEILDEVRLVHTQIASSVLQRG
jgi:hypothetical protein